MTVEAGRGAMGEERDEFPVGMRVLAVDDDITCLKVLEAMLRQCRYHVTTTNQAVKALRMLRENKDKFDIIITDVHMPEMDGFNLLELVGLEMDLPVIMLSAYGDTEIVMKGINHGACDYLLKPVRLEELKNIWQHVIRKKKSVPKELSSSDNTTSAPGGQGPITSGSSEHKVNRKRKDQNEDDDDDNEENNNENENTSSQKKARVVWSVELHRKFIAAINHLGVNKAVPKRILDLMNVEGLTRENVASHLQKYRLYLKKMADDEANLAATLGVRDSYLPLAALNGFAEFHSYASSGQLPVIQSFSRNGGLGRRDSPLVGHNSSISHGNSQVLHTHNGINDLYKQQHITGSPHSALTMDRFQQQNNRFSSNITAGGLAAGVLGTSGFNVPMSTVTNNPSTLQVAPSRFGSITSESFEVNGGLWQSAGPSTGAASGLQINHGFSPVGSQANSNLFGFPSSRTPVVPVSGNSMLMLKGTSEDQKYISSGTMRNSRNIEPNVGFSSSLYPSLPSQSVTDLISQGQRFNNGMYNGTVSTNINGQSHHSTAMVIPQQSKIDKSISGQLNFSDTYSLENATLPGGFGSNDYSYDELVNIIKPEREDADGSRGIFH